jgi:hypothetical protein
MTFWSWSKTASSNATADATINWAEGQAPSTVNNSARAMMAALAKYRDDMAGVTTAGTSTAYTLTSNQVFTSLTPALNGKLIGVIPHATCGLNPTLNVDGLGAKALRNSPGVAVATGQLIAGTSYLFVYKDADACFYLVNPPTTTWLIPIGGILPYSKTTAPNSRFALCYGQAISRATYAELFALISTTYGVGDGSTTFNIPDLRGRTTLGQADVTGTIPSGLTTTASAATVAGQVIGWTLVLPYIMRVL